MPEIAQRREYRLPQGNNADNWRTFPGFQIVAVKPDEEPELREQVVCLFLPTLDEAELFRDGYNAGASAREWAEIRPVAIPSTAAAAPRKRQGAK